MTKKLYLITPDMPLERYIKKLKAVLPAGIDYLQYRRKNVDFETAVQEATQLKMLCALYNTALIVNDFSEVALKVGADGVHFGQSDYTAEAAKRCKARGLIVGRTAKTPEQAERATKDGADYLGVGAFFPSGTKKEALPMSMETLQKLRNITALPLYAIGGIAPEKLTAPLMSRVEGICFSGAVFTSETPMETLERFKEKCAVL